MRPRRRPIKQLFLALLIFLAAWQIVWMKLPRDARLIPPLSWAMQGIVATGAVLHNGWNSIRTATGVYLDAVDVASHAEDLQRENEQLKFQNWWLQRALDDRQVIDQMIGWTMLPWTGSAARVVFHDAMDRYRSAWLQVPDDAVVAGQAVLAPAGLAGRVVDQQGRFAHVLLVQDVESAVDVVSESGVRAIVRGTGADSGRLNFVPRYEPLQVGEQLLTSGRDGGYPAGVSVGVVIDIDRSPEDMYLKGRVQFHVRPQDLGWVRTVPPDATFLPQRQ